MQLLEFVTCSLILNVLVIQSETYCMQEPHRTFHLIKRCQRSNQNMIKFDNVASLDECFKVAEQAKALALNYSPLRGMAFNLFKQNEDLNLKFNFSRRKKRRHFFEQPEEFFNCHALQCPESLDFTTMVNDSRYDYYSLYGNVPAPNNFVCVPEVGIFQLNSSEETYESAFKLCKNSINGSLAHVASEKRTNALSKLLRHSDFKYATLKLAYVGLNLTRKQNRIFKTNENEDLNCFLYRSWAPGHPKEKGKYLNSSCVAITGDNSWMTVDCDKKLPFICEIYTAPLNKSLFLDACDLFLNN